MSLIENRNDTVLLKLTEFPPTQGVDDMVLEGGMKPGELGFPVSETSPPPLGLKAVWSSTTLFPSMERTCPSKDEV